jgi:hypothetical protein
VSTALIYAESGSSPPTSSRMVTLHDPSAPTLRVNKNGIPVLPPNKACLRKYRFSDRLEALLYAAILNGRPQSDAERIAKPYFCTFCGKHHITSGGIVRIIDRTWSQVAA